MPGSRGATEVEVCRMKKFTLNPRDLRVETFSPATAMDGPREDGTVVTEPCTECVVFCSQVECPEIKFP